MWMLTSSTGRAGDELSEGSTERVVLLSLSLAFYVMSCSLDHYLS